MNLASPYNRKEYLNFFQNDFLTDSFILNEEEIKPEFKNNYINEIRLLGKDSELELNVYEVKHNSVNDPRVGLSKESFRMMAQFSVRKALILFISENSDNYRLSLVTIDLKLEGDKVKKEYSNPRRYSFFIGPDAKLHTPEKFLISKGRVKDFEDLQSRFSVEVVNKEFYQQIALMFTELTGGKRKVGSRIEDFRRKLSLPSVTEPEVYQEFAVRLIGRLVFCWFLKMKKSEAGIPLIPEEVLSLEAAKNTNGYYHEVLEKLFFEILNTDIDDRKDEFKKEPYSLIPFLNGGLFTPHIHDYYETYKTGISKHLNTLKVPVTWLREFIEILETYNFTVDENTSVDIDLSVDPEMLGRIFENLLAEINPETGESARKATGSYYTPRPIVEYMVDESLKQYLVTETKIEEYKLTQLLSYTDEDIDLTDNKKQLIVDALGKVKILDPACGSGAFPIGVLQKMLPILQKVDPNSELWLDKQLGKIDIAALRNELKKKLTKDNVDYIHKLGIIQNSIYGVDIQPIAAEISKLRCFLSLIVDELVEDRKRNRGILPLPNLEFKFVAANTLIGLPEKQEQEDMFNVDNEVSELEEIRKQYFTSSGKKKKALEEKFIDTQKKLAQSFIRKNAKDERALKLTNWNPFSDEPSDWFDTEWMFGVEDGFNVIIGNPPYILSRESFSKNEKLYFQEHYNYIYEKINTYLLFIEKSDSILNLNGSLAFIIPNSWLGVDSASKLRRFILENYTLIRLLNLLGETFENAGVEPIILIYAKNKSNKKVKYATVTDKNIFNQDLFASHQQEWLGNRNAIIDITSNETEQKLLQKIVKKSIQLSDKYDVRVGLQAYEKGKGIPKQSANDVKKHVFDYDYKFDKNTFPYWRGADIKRYGVEWSGQWLRWGEWLSQPKSFDQFSKPRILIREITGKFPFVLKCTFVSDIYLNNKSILNILQLTDEFDLKFLLAFLNSKLMAFYHIRKTVKGNRSLFPKLVVKDLKYYPIPNISVQGQKTFSEIVDEIIKEKKCNSQVDTANLENKIDILVYKLYNLEYQETKIVDPQIENIISKDQYENFKVK